MKQQLKSEHDIFLPDTLSQETLKLFHFLIKNVCPFLQHLHYYRRIDLLLLTLFEMSRKRKAPVNKNDDAIAKRSCIPSSIKSQTLFDTIPFETIMRVVRFAQHVSNRRSAQGALTLLHLGGPIAEAAKVEFTKWTEERDNKKLREHRIAERRNVKFEEPEGLQLSTRLISDYDPLYKVAKLIGTEVFELQFKDVRMTYPYIEFVKKYLPNIRRMFFQGKVGIDSFQFHLLFDAPSKLEFMEFRDVDDSHGWISSLRTRVKKLKRLRIITTKRGTLHKSSYFQLDELWNCAAEKDSLIEDVEIECKCRNDELFYLKTLSDTGVPYSIIRRA